MTTKVKKEEVAASSKKVSRKKSEPKKKVATVKTKKRLAKQEKVADKKKKAGDWRTVSEKTEKKEQKNKKSESGQEMMKGEKEYFLRWKGPDFVRTVGEEYLYRASLVLSGLIVLWSLWQMNFFTALSFTILIAVVAFELKSQPREVEYEVNLEGVMIDGRLLRFSEMRSFDISEKAGLNIVRLQMKTAIFPMKEVFLEEGQDLVYVKTLFGYFLPEEKQEDKLFNFKEKKELTEDEYLDKVVDDYIKGKF